MQSFFSAYIGVCISIERCDSVEDVSNTTFKNAELFRNEKYLKSVNSSLKCTIIKKICHFKHSANT